MTAYDRIDWNKVGPYYSVDVLDGCWKGLSGLVVGWNKSDVFVEFEGFNLPPSANGRLPKAVSWQDVAIYQPLR